MTDLNEGYEEEFALAQEIKEKFCDKAGKETKPQKSAEILHRIALIYSKRSDKISLIKSVGLLNAAIIRNPANVSQIKWDLIETCQLILQKANARNQKADLISKGNEIKNSFKTIRDKVQKLLHTKVPQIPTTANGLQLNSLILSKISAIQLINENIADDYKQIMRSICVFCQNIMGEPPCDFAIVGMGSLARQEITLYSDFEHIILLIDVENYESCLEYFRWFSVVFHIIILNVQESIIPSLDVSCLNDKNSKLGSWFYDAITPRGISFDGMMPHACKFPLGRQHHTSKKPFITELIKPVSKMLEYLSTEADLKNGYHLADILTKTCFVFGNEEIFLQFSEGASGYISSKTREDVISGIQKQVQDDLSSFSARFRLSTLKAQNQINIKQLIYQSTTLFIAALATVYKITANSSFDVIDQMVKIKKITQNTAKKLQFAIAIACEMRLRVYTESHAQCDTPIDLKENSENILKFLEIVGVASTINYFQIAYCLQCEVAKQLTITKLHFYSDPQLINITIGLAFGIEKMTEFTENQQKRFWDSKAFDFDKCIAELEAEDILSKGTELSINTADLNKPLSEKKIETVANYLYASHEYDEAVEFYKELLDHYQQRSSNVDSDYDIARIKNLIGCCYDFSNQPAEGLEYLLQALEIRQKISPNPERDRDVAKSFHDIGLCHDNLQQYDAALKALNQALQIYENSTENPDKDRQISLTLNNIGLCYIDLQRYDVALKILNRDRQIKLNTTSNADKDRDLAMTIGNIGMCHMYLHQYDDALKVLQRSLEIYENASLNIAWDRDIVRILSTIGICHIDLQQYDLALKAFNRQAEIIQNTTLNADKDRNVARVLHNSGYCQIDLQQYDGAYENLSRALEIKQNSTSDESTDISLAVTRCEVGRCLTRLQRFDESWDCLEEALKVFKNASENELNDINIADTLTYMAESLCAQQKQAQAVSYFEQASKIYKSTTNSDDYSQFARALHSYGCCLVKLQKYPSALSVFKHSLAIYEKLPKSDFVQKEIADIRANVDECSLKV